MERDGFVEVSLRGEEKYTESARYVIDCEGVVGTLKRKITGEVPGYITTFQTFNEGSIELDPHYFYAYLQPELSEYDAWFNVKDDLLVLGVSVKDMDVSRSGYYGWLKREADGDGDRGLTELIAKCHKQHKGRYGYRRVVKWLKREKGLTVNHKKVLRITSANNMLSTTRRKKPFSYKPNGDLRYENVMNRDFHADRPNEKWVTDISYIIVPEGTLYLSAIRDLCGNFIVAYKTAKRQDYSLVKNTISAAVVAEKPPKDLILHSDGGGQYRSWDYHFQVEENGLRPSMSKPGTPGDNAMAENFFSIFKSECIYLERPKTLSEAEKLTDDFVWYYNYERIQGNGLTPYEQREAAKV